MDQWAHDTAAALLNAEDRSLANADNTMGWQPLIFGTISRDLRM